jgi:hypothetical protein
MTSKEPKFTGILAGVTVLCVGGLYTVADQCATRYDQAKLQFDELTGEINRMLNMPLFPSQQNLQAKQEALAEFKKDAGELAAKLQAKRPKSLQNTDPQTFTDTLVKTATECLKAYADVGIGADDAKTGMPKGFYLGFEEYVSTPAQGGATGLLGYQLGAISELHKTLASAKPNRLVNFLRVKQPEEKSQPYTPEEGAAYRALPLEVTFSGSENSMREFINGLQTSQKYFFLIRTLRIKNEKQVGPKASDVQFDDAQAGAGAGEVPTNIFDSPDAFNFADDGNPAEGEDKKTEPESVLQPSSDSSRILKQVLGSENIEVFLRIDLLLMNPAAPESK